MGPARGAESLAAATVPHARAKRRRRAHLGLNSRQLAGEGTIGLARPELILAQGRVHGRVSVLGRAADGARATCGDCLAVVLDANCAGQAHCARPGHAREGGGDHPLVILEAGPTRVVGRRATDQKLRRTGGSIVAIGACHDASLAVHQAAAGGDLQGQTLESGVGRDLSASHALAANARAAERAVGLTTAVGPLRGLGEAIVASQAAALPCGLPCACGGIDPEATGHAPSALLADALRCRAFERRCIAVQVCQSTGISESAIGAATLAIPNVSPIDGASVLDTGGLQSARDVAWHQGATGSAAFKGARTSAIDLLCSALMANAAARGACLPGELVLAIAVVHARATWQARH
mmetsp:Transcript_90927/g.293562  ORF Transcript_90927/g.293562 Transcript_90927/m.293562 type:complete len:352 (+) Transcript_90927:3108-4163(+)